MTKQTEALKMAIDKWKNNFVDERHLNQQETMWWFNQYKMAFNELLNACKDALAQPSVAELNDEYLRDTHVEGLQPAQQPVAWMNDIAYSDEIDNLPANRGDIIPLYAHPTPSWQGLSDDEKLAIIRKWKDAHTMRAQELIGLGDAFEQAIKEKNT